MGTIIYEDGFRIMVYPNDHEPPHVHVYKSGHEAKITIGDKFTFPAIIDNTGMRNKDIKKALELVKYYQDLLLTKWGEIHG